MLRKTRSFKWQSILIVVFSLLGFFLRFNRLGDIPPGLGRDEASIGYNAYSIVLTGRDEYGKWFPIYFESVSDYKLPVIFYLTALPISLFGLNSFATRFAAASLGSLTVVVVYFLTRKAVFLEDRADNQKLAVLTAFLLAINPWHIFHSRAAYEVVIGLFFFTLGWYFFLRGIIYRNWIVLAIVAFVAAFYTYSLTRLLAPLLFLYLCFIYRDKLLRIQKKSFFISFLFAVFLLLPFTLTFLGPGGISQPKNVLIFTSSQTITTFFEFRSYILNSHFAFIGPLIFNKLFMFVYEYCKNILSALSLKFYFVSGSKLAGIGTNGQFYLVESISFIVGLFFVARDAFRGNRFFAVIFGWIAIIILVASLTIDPPEAYATRTFFMTLPVVMVIGVGWLKLYDHFAQIKYRRYIFIGILFLIYSWQFTYYLLSYYLRFPPVYASTWDARSKDLSHYLAKYEDAVDYIVITKPEKSMYIFLLFYNQIPPWDVWGKIEYYPTNSEGWRYPRKFGKYEFREINWDKDDISKRNTLLVAEGGEYPDYQAVTQEIHYPTVYTVYPNGQEIIALPEQKIAFRIWNAAARK